MTAILHTGDPARGALWQAVFAEQMPEMDFRCWPEIGNAEEIRYLIAWTLDPELVAALDNLEVVFSIGAGVDQLDLSCLPPHVRVVRMIESGITTTMVEYVSMAALMLHRDMPFYATEQRESRWSHRDVKFCSERTVGVMGLGELGRASLARLNRLGFRTIGWSRSGGAIEGTRCYGGSGQLGDFLADCEILVCLLPLTDETRGVLSRDLFDRMPMGASLINVARGGHLVEQDLLDALDRGQLRYAMLDVADPEPLPEGHPFYSHPAIVLTPHIAGVTRKDTAVHSLIANVRRALAGEPFEGEVDRSRGY
ncbi:MAG: glyoxylate/hydroxypyruvate reductase A [Novosphingobium sp.]|nr:glyoxylate/hydroxypyruvate reductase A [Novosphingobium sp.]